MIVLNAKSVIENDENRKKLKNYHHKEWENFIAISKQWTQCNDEYDDQ